MPISSRKPKHRRFNSYYAYRESDRTEGEERDDIVLAHEPRDDGLVEGPDFVHRGLRTRTEILLDLISDGLIDNIKRGH